MEDLDQGRCRDEYYHAIEDDLGWLKIDWDGPILRQSKRHSAYKSALEKLSEMGLVYPCTCTRKDLQRASSAPQEGDPEAAVYPGICKGRTVEHGTPSAIRLDMEKAIDHLGGAHAISELSFNTSGMHEVTGHEALSPADLLTRAGDIVLMRKDNAAAYHLAVVVDDAYQRITHVTRGEDLRGSTPVHRLLQALLDLPTPIYHHHALIRDETGKRLAKRDDARALRTLREQGFTPDDLFEILGVSDLVAEFAS
jgi:glutamyl-Q tRNA(Asp) synthetase